jgi:Leucine Rich repeat
MPLSGTRGGGLWDGRRARRRGVVARAEVKPKWWSNQKPRESSLPASGRRHRAALLCPSAFKDNAAMQTAPPKAEPPKRKRRWFQFSLRTLMIVTVICAIASAWVTGRRDQKRKEQEAVSAIVKLGGLAWYDYESVRGARPSGPAGLREFLGDSFFSEVAVVNLDTEPFMSPVASNEAKVLFEGVARSLAVDRHDSKVTDADLLRLETLVHVKMLNLGRTKITDAGLAHIAVLPELQTLYLYGTNVGDAGLARINGLTHLQSLDLRETNVSDAGLAHLEALGQLRAIGLRETNIGDAGLAHLKGLTQLHELNLWGTKVTDAGLREVERLTQLQWLDLGSTIVSDAGLKHLRGLKNLQKLNLWLTNVSDAGVDDLEKALPKCEVWSVEGFGEPGMPWHRGLHSVSDR